MLFYSTEGKIRDVPFEQAVLHGYAPDGGLYLPQSLPKFTPQELKRLQGLSFLDSSIELCTSLFKGIFSSRQVEKLCQEAFNFPLSFISLPDRLHVLELFHGPTLSFKDFGARFIAALLKMWRCFDQEILVLVATSGDTGSAIGQAFCGIPGIRVFILYPKGKVAPVQEKQLTTIGHNVKALAVEGSFEACQKLLKQALLDEKVQQERLVTTGNSINVARLFPQMLYYFYAYNQLYEYGPPAVFSVPCGNFGHLISGILAKRMGLLADRFLAATNVNDEVPVYLQTGVFSPHEAYRTVAVSMDVGNPSNFPRLVELYGNSLEKLRQELIGMSFTDAQILEAIQMVYDTSGYILDPHSATAYLALKEHCVHQNHPAAGILLSTAHPAKFKEGVQTSISVPIETPQRLHDTLSKGGESISIPASYAALKELLMGVSYL